MKKLIIPILSARHSWGEIIQGVSGMRVSSAHVQKNTSKSEEISRLKFHARENLSPATEASTAVMAAAQPTVYNNTSPGIKPSASLAPTQLTADLWL